MRPLATIVWTAALVLESGAAFLWAGQGGAWSPWALAAHLAAAAFLAAPACLGGRGARRRVLAGCQAVVLLLVPVLGLVLAAWMGLRVGLSRPAGVGTAYREYVAWRESRVRRVEDEGEAAGRIRRGLSVISLDEVLTSGEFAQKRLLIERLARRSDRDSVRLLQRALRDTHPDIRTYAAGGLARIEARVTEEVQRAEAAAARDPESAETRARLGNRYFDMASLGLLDEATRRYYLERSVRALSEAIDRDTTQARALVRLGEALLALGQGARALRYLDLAVELEPASARALCLRAEAHFHAGSMARMQEDARAALALGAGEEDVWETLRWLTDEPTRA
ncbi:MAG: hypothetical protein HY722_04700 [Planctomycetes bacterium]|nr:hypothetical protein [Planctomycetota bacterium]